MQYLSQVIDPEHMADLEVIVDDWFFVLASTLLLIEVIRYAVKKRMSWRLGGDMVTNYLTLAMFIGLGLLYYGSYIYGFYLVYEYLAPWQIPINGWTIGICVILADFAYYWEHRFSHRVGIGWATHTVHHSSPHFNISVAYRFGPLDGIFPFFFHVPLALIGFHPLLIFFAEKMVQIYQTLLHTETVGKLPQPIEAVMNTPSHHRVHHGSNQQYLDKNYAGIFIIWDRLFGSFAEEKEKVAYGLVRPINSINPVIVFLHGFPRLFEAVKENGVTAILKPPGWTKAK